MSECKKLAKRTDEWNAIYKFYEWLQEQRITLARWDDRLSYGITPVTKHIQDLLYEYFEVNPIKLEQERREILRKLREKQPPNL